jgi:hypothetical protein
MKLFKHQRLLMKHKKQLIRLRMLLMKQELQLVNLVQLMLSKEPTKLLKLLMKHK